MVHSYMWKQIWYTMSYDTRYFHDIEPSVHVPHTMKHAKPRLKMSWKVNMNHTGRLQAISDQVADMKQLVQESVGDKACQELELRSATQ